MKAIILAAGRGTRMMPLTKNTPKPLLKVKGLSLIEHNIKALKSANIVDIVINTAYLGQQIEQKLGNGQTYGVNIVYSHEQGIGLETAGGIINALPLLGKQPFLVLNGDVLADYCLKNLNTLASNKLAHLVLTLNPSHNPNGDFFLNDNYNQKYTYTGIGLYHPKLFSPYPNQRLALRHILVKAFAQQQISTELYQGFWCDVGTPKRLNQLQNETLV